MADPLGPSILSLLLLVISSFVYTLNTALPGVDQSELTEQAEQGSSHAKRVLRLLRRLDEGYGEIRMTYILLLSFAYASLFSWLEPLMAQAMHTPALLNVLITLVAFFLLAFTLTAIIPGGIAANSPKSALKLSAPLAEFAVYAMSPITLSAYWIGKAVLHPFHIRPGMAAEHISEEEIRMMMDMGEESGAIESDEREMIDNIFEFNNMDAEDCMVHRKDITAIDVDSDPAEIMTAITESGRSRFPVYEDSIDNVIGILTSRDFLIDRCSAAPKTIRELIRPAHFVPESVHTDILLREMQSRKQHMAIVVDEYGGTSGLITLEDLLEEIVGNIYDEFDPKEEQEITPIADGRWRVSGSVDLETLADELDIDLPLDEEYDTLGGLVFSHLNEIPADGTHPTVECFGLRISVIEVADRRIEWAFIELLPKEENGDNDNEDESNPR